MGLKDWRERARMLKELAARQLIERLEEEPLVGEATERLRRWLGEPAEPGEREPAPAGGPGGSAPSVGSAGAASPEVAATEQQERSGAPSPAGARGSEPPGEGTEAPGAAASEHTGGAAEANVAATAGPAGEAPEAADTAPSSEEETPAEDGDASLATDVEGERPPLVSAALARLLAEQGKLRMAAEVAEQVLARGEDEVLARELGCSWAADAASWGEVAEGCFPVAAQHGTLSVGWAVSEARLRRAGRLLAGEPSLTVRLVLWGLDAAGEPRRRLLEREAAGPVGYVRFDDLQTGERVVVSVGLRSGERFVSAVHAGPLAVA